MDSFFTKSGSSPGKTQADFTLFSDVPHASVYLLTAHTDAAEKFVAQFLPDDAMRLGAAIAIDHRCLHPILAKIDAEGLRVEVLR